ncbi:hypothetical protein ACIHFE_06990 [Streptomyces sp. NPDC052396]|uniref:hypothetical protein n=1 Tax=Streptomyces sp. NPDC052396 TaxID=3365689 RepID=UPI0037D95992
MDLAPYVDALRRELAVAAEAGGPEARALAGRLAAPLSSAARLTLLNALSAAADEITRELAPGSVEVRLRGLDPEFALAPPPRHDIASGVMRDAVPPSPGGTRPAATAEGEDGATARISLRLPGGLKARAEEAAGREGQSVNAWLVRAVGAALEPQGGDPRAGRGRQRRPDRAR